MEASLDLSGEPWFAPILAAADIEPVARGRTFSYAPDLRISFVMDADSGTLFVGPQEIITRSTARLVLRHAAELGLALDLCSRDPVLAGLMAARTVALFARLECGPEHLRELPPWYVALGSEQPLPRSALQRLWPTLAVHQSGAAAEVATSSAAELEAIWGLLGPVEHLMGTGGDVRIRLDPETGLNAYGCSSRPRSWAVTFASSTASSVSERGYAGAEGARRRVLSVALEHGVARSKGMAAERVRRGLAEYYRLPLGARIVLAPSGTDGELCAVAIAQLAERGQALTNLVVAPEETGTGVPLAARGRHFDTLTARGSSVRPERVIDGFSEDIRLDVISVRESEGGIRPGATITADCSTKLAIATREHRRVLLHLMDQSKTGLLVSETLASLAAARDDIDVLVDACQARLSVATVNDYIRRGFMVLLTGSKFFTGPPFSGALLLPVSIAVRLDGNQTLPSGLADYFGRFDWPEGAEVCRELSDDGNLGLVFRWEAALAEMRAFAAVEEDRIEETLSQFGRQVRTAIVSNEDLCLQDTPPPVRVAHPERWDCLSTIFTFAIWTRDPKTHGRRLMNSEEARQIYRWLNADASVALNERQSEAEQTLAARQFHIGQPVNVSTPHGPAGALRISAGARLVSGEPSQASLDPRRRLQAEIGDALAALDKISLLLKHLDRLRLVDPGPRYLP